MVDSTREVIGAVLKYMGASYNTKNISSQIPGGRDAVQQNLTSLAKQVRYILFQSDDKKCNVFFFQRLLLATRMEPLPLSLSLSLGI